MHVRRRSVIASVLASGAAGGRTVARVTVLGTDGYQITLDGQLVGVDPSNDLAVLRVAAPPEILRQAIARFWEGVCSVFPLKLCFFCAVLNSLLPLQASGAGQLLRPESRPGRVCHR